MLVLFALHNIFLHALCVVLRNFVGSMKMFEGEDGEDPYTLQARGGLPAAQGASEQEGRESIMGSPVPSIESPMSFRVAALKNHEDLAEKLNLC